MRKGMSQADAEGLHLRLVWLAAHADQSRTELARLIERNPGTMTPWFQQDGWSLPDAKGLMGLLRHATVRGEPVSTRWLMLGEGAPTEARSTKEGALVYRGARMVLTEVELFLARLGEGLRREEGAAPAATGTAAGAAARVEETDRLLEKGKPRRRGQRRTG